MSPPTCDICGIDLTTTGSHYHCGVCRSTDTTSMLGHYTVHCKVTGTRRAQHLCCPDRCALEEVNAK